MSCARVPVPKFPERRKFLTLLRLVGMTKCGGDRHLSASGILCNIAREGWFPWLSYLLKRLPRLATAIASADAMNWPAYEMKIRAKAIAPPVEKTITN